MSGEFSVTPDDVDAVAAWTVIRAARELARRLAEELAPLGVTPIEFGALVQLASRGEHNQAELARAVGVRPQSMAALVGGLETRGLVQRGAAPGRGRASRLHLTQDGRTLLAEAWPRVRASDAWFGDDSDTVAAALRPFTSDGTIGSPADGVI